MNKKYVVRLSKAQMAPGCSSVWLYQFYISEKKRILLPMASVSDIPTIPGELFAKFQTGFYADPRDAAFKALGVE